MAVQNLTPSEGGPINKRWNPAMTPFRPSGYLANPITATEIDGALMRIAEAAALVGPGDGGDWSNVYAAIQGAREMIDSL